MLWKWVATPIRTYSVLSRKTFIGSGHSSACLAENPGALNRKPGILRAKRARRMTSHRPLGATGKS